MNDEVLADEDGQAVGIGLPVGDEVGVEFPDPLAKIGDIAAAAGIRRVDMVAWRDLDHPEAGGSELHAASIAERWAAAGIEVRLTASRAEGAAAVSGRDGYRVDRPAGRYGIFPAVAARRLASRHIGRHIGGRPTVDQGHGIPDRRSAGPDATVEIWNGMPFFSPLWAPRPRLVFLHHVHDGMWDLVLPAGLAAAGRFLESRLAPPIYRRTPVVTLSESSRHGIVDLLKLDPGLVHVVQPGVDESFCPGPSRHQRPLVVAVGRLVPYKRFDRLIEVLVRLHERHPDLEAVIAGEGQERAALEDLIRRHGAGSWLSLPGRIDDEALLELYQRAWVLASTSAYEGWGLTITEAAACATPAVVSPIAGHFDAVHDGVTGFLAQPGEEMETSIDALLSNPLLRRRMQRAARRRAAALTWDRTALETMRLLADQA
ncbi:MAG TPA: glycosyltransferase family 4 protein [Acidimicrobiales bacterium]|nr:glycosyltransferase family 4 protein [Acidimicrobiales bacterium]